MPKTRRTRQTKVPEYKPDSRERGRDAVLKPRKSPRVNISVDGRVAKIAVDHSDPATGFTLLMESLGTTDSDFLDGFLAQVINASSGADPDVNFILSVIKGIEPRDQIEAMLAAQMAAVHS